MEEPQEIAEPLVAPGTPWGPWATGGFGILIVLTWNVVQAIVVLVLWGGIVRLTDAFSQGWIVARAVLLSAPIPLGAVLLLASVRKGLGVGAYLGLSWPPAREVVRWTLLFLGLLVASDALSLALGRPVVPEPMVPLYRTTGSLPIFLFGIVVAASVAEEFLFRGFLQTGLIRSRLRPLGGIVLTTLAWGLLHVQYDAYGIATVVAMGLLLGVIRWRTGSLWLCVFLHALANALASAEAFASLAKG
jgi:hypothetical protein